MGSSSDSEDYDVADDPEREVEIEAEDIELGTSEQTEGTDLRTQGKRALTKPSGTTTSGVNV